MQVGKWKQVYQLYLKAGFVLGYFNGLGFEKISPADIEALSGIMKRAFDEDAKRHLGEETGGPPGYDNGEFLRRWYLNSDADAYVILQNGVLIGGINVFIHANNENILGNMFVDPQHQDKGLGTIIWSFIEHKYPDTIKWKTETPGFSKRNHNFYVNKCGFKIVRIENPKDKYAESYILEKEMQVMK
ncbi:GNAT family N-acetyltransferase [Oscillospiraceae bacterium OttesenSCG-928-G22]|nr:GNAT family N-acetyltransferase [Christensenellaceae bacterium OttesenSCG-928-M15]MDL2273725.1 GNAT family N-acetyltransferase [Oscillospiraceae bacterium OttesenSCG-928-G22]